MDNYQIVKTLHILSSTLLFGTGIGIAFFMFLSRFSKNLQERFFAARITVLADYCFTFPSVFIQPVTGIWLAYESGYDMTELWLVGTYILYGIALCCWLPVVFIQIKLRNIIAMSLSQNQPLPSNYDRLFNIWFGLGWPAFFSFLTIFFLMVIKPV